MDFSSLSDGDWQNFTYSLLILVMLCSSLFSRRDIGMAKIFKYLAIWSALALVIIALYSYRFEFADFKSRILGEVLPTKVQTKNSQELIINMAQDGHFYIDSKVNGHPVRFMIDTGASDVVINKNLIEKIGLKRADLKFNKIYQTANGKSFGASIVIKELEIGELKFFNLNASVNDADMGVSLLGMSFLRQFKKYEFSQGRLILVIEN